MTGIEEDTGLRMGQRRLGRRLCRFFLPEPATVTQRLKPGENGGKALREAALRRMPGRKGMG